MFEKYFPLIKVKNEFKDKPWITPELKIEIKKRE